MTKKIGFIVNPIAGMGGKVGLKGTDDVLNKAVNLGAKPIAENKALETLKEYILRFSSKDDLYWYTCSGIMGEKELKKVGIIKIDIVYNPNNKTTTAKIITFKGNGLQPGVDLDDTSSLLDLMDK